MCHVVYKSCHASLTPPASLATVTDVSAGVTDCPIASTDDLDSNSLSPSATPTPFVMASFWNIVLVALVCAGLGAACWFLAPRGKHQV